MTPKEILQEWIDCFNAADAVALANLYAQDAINHQVANTPVIGKTAIHKMFVNEFATSKMVCIVEHRMGYHGMERSARVARMRILPCAKR